MLMGTPITEDDVEYKMFGRLIRAAFGLDTTWQEHGRCRSWRTDQPDAKKSPWLEGATRGKNADGVSGVEIVKAALMLCSSCPVQYDCAEYALQGLMIAGTWAMDINDLKWLQRQTDGQSIVDLARVQKRPVQDVVVQVHTIRGG